MPSHRFVQLDVFTQEAFAGNPLAVFSDSTGIPADQMQMQAAQLDLQNKALVNEKLKVEIQKEAQGDPAQAPDPGAPAKAAGAAQQVQIDALKAEREIMLLDQKLALGENIDEASKTEIETAIKDVNEAVKGEDADDIRAKTERLQTAFHRVSEAMYERAQAAAQQEEAASSTNGASSDGAGEEEVVDAEVVDEQK